MYLYLDDYLFDYFDNNFRKNQYLYLQIFFSHKFYTNKQFFLKFAIFLLVINLQFLFYTLVYSIKFPKSIILSVFLYDNQHKLKYIFVFLLNLCLNHDKFHQQKYHNFLQKDQCDGILMHSMFYYIHINNTNFHKL